MWDQPRPLRKAERLTFAPLAWLKLMFFLHAGDTEIGGFGIATGEDPLYIDEFQTVPQQVSPVINRFDDDGVADYFDDCVDRGLVPQQFARIWCHTHPGTSPQPSGTDEETLARVFGKADWSVMFITGRTQQMYARLTFTAGPGGIILLPVFVDWSRWPQTLTANPDMLSALPYNWAAEYQKNIRPEVYQNRSSRFHDNDPRDPAYDEQVFGSHTADLSVKLDLGMQSIDELTQVWRDRGNVGLPTADDLTILQFELENEQDLSIEEALER